MDCVTRTRVSEGGKRLIKNPVFLGQRINHFFKRLCSGYENFVADWAWKIMSNCLSGRIRWLAYNCTDLCYIKWCLYVSRTLAIVSRGAGATTCFRFYFTKRACLFKSQVRHNHTRHHIMSTCLLLFLCELWKYSLVRVKLCSIARE